MHRLVCTSLDWMFTEVTQHHKNQIREKQLPEDEKSSESQLPPKQGRHKVHGGKAAFIEAPGDSGDTPPSAAWFSVWICGSISNQFFLKAGGQDKTPKEELKDERWRLRGKRTAGEGRG